MFPITAGNYGLNRPVIPRVSGCESFPYLNEDGEEIGKEFNPASSTDTLEGKYAGVRGVDTFEF
jgi:hypothetical protein